MKNQKKISIFIFLLIGVTISTSTNAFAYTGYAGADTKLYYASQQAFAAKTCFNKTNYSTSLVSGSNYTKASVRNTVPSVKCFYVSCHGASNAEGFFTYDTKEYISSGELSNWTGGFYKFAFIDACHSGETQALYNAFNMKDSDGRSHAFLGWTNVSYDNVLYATFTNKVFSNLMDGKNLNDSVWSAGFGTGVKNYKIYGDWKMKLTD